MKRNRKQQERNKKFRENFYPRDPSIDLLKERMHEAVKKEEYEVAACLRDWIADTQDLFGEEATGGKMNV